MGVRYEPNRDFQNPEEMGGEATTRQIREKPKENSPPPFFTQIRS